ncbi:hypothetical protein E2C01_039287 [Portunus trituberculatus]|uniref:Uncharacterized protein n=1 Tax=Portunus trituberculatus TaxID=210409 RepID=A0A5B7FKA4_PORTR|nr:hypothetical protein [Portunus trituberculatus]
MKKGEYVLSSITKEDERKDERFNELQNHVNSSNLAQPMKDEYVQSSITKEDERKDERFSGLFFNL